MPGPMSWSSGIFVYVFRPLPNAWRIVCVPRVRPRIPVSGVSVALLSRALKSFSMVKRFGGGPETLEARSVEQINDPLE